MGLGSVGSSPTSESGYQDGSGSGSIPAPDWWPIFLIDLYGGSLPHAGAKSPGSTRCAPLSLLAASVLLGAKV